MPPLPLEINLFLLLSEAFDSVVLLRDTAHHFDRLIANCRNRSDTPNG